MADQFPPDYSTSVGKVRALIPDVEQVDWENDGNASYMFTDNHLEGLLALYPAIENPDDVDYTSTVHIRRAAADAVDVLATSEALISKVIKTALKYVPARRLFPCRRSRQSGCARGSGIRDGRGGGFLSSRCSRLLRQDWPRRIEELEG